MLWAGGAGELHELVAVLADEPLLVVAGDVVPHLQHTVIMTPTVMCYDVMMALTAPSA